MTEQRIATNKRDIFESINEFYKMKDKYETAFNEKYIKPILKAENKSKREKRMAFSKLPKADCINCKRPVGTVFSIKKQYDNFTPVRKYLAKCGDLNEPCPLNINIQFGESISYENEIQQNEKEINEYKKNIIKEKYNMMFGYTPEEIAIEHFEQFAREMKDYTYLAGLFIEKNILVNDNPEKKELLKKSIDTFGKEYILKFKQMMKQYDETGDEMLVREAVLFYKNEMMPRLKEIQELKYEVNKVEHDFEQNLFLLYQRKNSLQNLEYSYYKENKIIAFVKGTKEGTKEGSADKTKTLKINKTGSKSKTRKAPVILVEEEVEEEELKKPIEEEEEEEKGEDKLNKPIEEEPEAEEEYIYVPNSPEYNPQSPIDYIPNSPEQGV